MNVFHLIVSHAPIMPGHVRRERTKVGLISIATINAASVQIIHTFRSLFATKTVNKNGEVAFSHINDHRE